MRVLCVSLVSCKFGPLSTFVLFRDGNISSAIRGANPFDFSLFGSFVGAPLQGTGRHLPSSRSQWLADPFLDTIPPQGPPGESPPLPLLWTHTTRRSVDT